MPSDTLTWDIEVANTPLHEYVQWDVLVVDKPRLIRTTIDVAVDRTYYSATSWDVRTVFKDETSWDVAVSEQEGTYRGTVNTEAERDALPMLVAGDVVTIMEPTSGPRARDQHFTGEGFLEGVSHGGAEGKQKMKRTFPTGTGWWVELGEKTQPFRYTNGIITPIAVHDDGHLTFQLPTLGTAIGVNDPDGFERITLSSSTGLRSLAGSGRPGTVGVYGDVDIWFESRPEVAGGSPQIGVSLLGSGGSSSNGLSYQTEPIQASPGSWVLVAFEQATIVSPSMTPVLTNDQGLTFTLQDSVHYRGSGRRITLFRCKMPTTLTSPFRLTFTTTDEMQRGLWLVLQVDQAGATVITALQTTETTPGGTNNNGTEWAFSQTYSDADDRLLILVAHEENEATDWSSDPGFLYDEIKSVGTIQPTGSLAAGWLSSGQDTTPSVAWATDSAFGGIAVVLKAIATVPAEVAVVGIESDLPLDDFDPRDEDTATLYARRWPTLTTDSAIRGHWWTAQWDDDSVFVKRWLVGPNRVAHSTSSGTNTGADTTGVGALVWITDPGFISAGQLWKLTMWGRVSCPSDASPTDPTIVLDLDRNNPGTQILTLPFVTPTSSAETDEPYEMEINVGWASNSPNASAKFWAVGKLFTPGYGTTPLQVVRATGNVDTTVDVEARLTIKLGEATGGYALTSDYACLIVD